MIRLIKNSEDKTKVELIGDIGDTFWGEGWTLDRFRNEIETMDVGEVEIEIQSMGGDVLEAFAIFDAIRSLPQKVTTRMVGSTASAGTVIAMAGDNREITPNSRFLIHPSSTLTMGDSEEHKKSEEQLRSIDEQLVNIYRKVTGKKDHELKAQMKKGNWMSAQEALTWGFVDKLTDTKILNKSDMDEQFYEVLNVKDEAEALDKIKEMQNEVEQTKLRAAELQEIVDQYEADKAAEAAEAVKAYLAKAVEDKKITAESVDKWTKMAGQDFETVQATIDAIQVSTQAGFEQVIDKTEEVTQTDEERFWANWKAGKYVNDRAAAERDYEKAFGKPLI